MPRKKSYAHTITEAQFQARVVGLARRAGFRLPEGGPKGFPLDLVYHTFDSRRCAPGFPDLVMVHPETGRIVIAELKAEGGYARPEQRAWLEAFRKNPAVEVYVWKPRHWEEIQEILGVRDGRLFV